MSYKNLTRYGTISAKDVNTRLFKDFISKGVLIPFGDLVTKGDKSYLLLGKERSGKSTVGKMLSEGERGFPHRQDAPTLVYDDGSLYGVKTDPRYGLYADLEPLNKYPIDKHPIKSIFILQPTHTNGNTSPGDIEVAIQLMFEEIFNKRLSASESQKVSDILRGIPLFNVPGMGSPKRRIEEIINLMKRV